MCVIMLMKNFHLFTNDYTNLFPLIYIIEEILSLLFDGFCKFVGVYGGPALEEFRRNEMLMTRFIFVDQVLSLGLTRPSLSLLSINKSLHKINIVLFEKYHQSFGEEGSVRGKVKSIGLLLSTFGVYVFSALVLKMKWECDITILKWVIINFIANVMFIVYIPYSRRIKQTSGKHYQSIMSTVVYSFTLWTSLCASIAYYDYVSFHLINFHIWLIIDLSALTNRVYKTVMVLNVIERELEEETLCTICQEQTTHAVVLKCQHCFHKNCLIHWSETSDECPLCRKKLEMLPEGKDVVTELEENGNINVEQNEEREQPINEEDEIENWNIVEVE